MHRSLIILTFLGILFTATQFLPYMDDAFCKVEISKKAGMENDSENDSEDTDSDSFDEFFHLNHAQVFVTSNFKNIKRHLTEYNDYKCLSIYFQIFTPPPEC